MIPEHEMHALFDHLEDALVRGYGFSADGKVDVDDIQPIMESARAVLMGWRGVEPIKPRGMVA